MEPVEPGLPFAERRDGADERRHVHRAGGDQIDAPPDIPRSTRTIPRSVICRVTTAWSGSATSGVRLPTSVTKPPFLTQRIAAATVSRLTHDFERVVDLRRLGHIGDDAFGAHPARPARAGPAIEIDGDDRRGSRGARRTWMVSRPIMPHPMTATRSSAAGTPPLDRVHRDRERFHHRRVLERAARRAAGRESAPAPRRTRRRRRDGGSRRTTRREPSARRTGSRRRGGRTRSRRNTPSSRTSRDRRARTRTRRPDPLDHARRLVPHDERRNAPPGDAGVAVDVAAADPARAHADEHVLGADLAARPSRSSPAGRTR